MSIVTTKCSSKSAEITLLLDSVLDLTIIKIRRRNKSLSVRWLSLLGGGLCQRNRWMFPVISLSHRHIATSDMH